MNKSEPILRPCLYKIAHNARSSRRASWPHHRRGPHNARTVLHLLVLGQQGNRNPLNGHRQPRRRPIAGRRLHYRHDHLGMLPSVTAAEHPVDLLARKGPAVLPPNDRTATDGGDEQMFGAK